MKFYGPVRDSTRKNSLNFGANPGLLGLEEQILILVVACLDQRAHKDL